ncbi:hypothetical protein R1flu_021841 [Riccia fluitans]|uniref:Reverse transcriptase domain-containing protein n=1 Tax=Riccia fluitans TaxID=41844 RepID=A0ABD1ZQI3_9MARC
MALARSPRLSSGGPSGMVFELLRDCFTHEDPASGFDLLFELCTRIAQGQVSPSIAYLLGASRLLSLEKPSGGVRPIVVGEVLYQLVACTLGFQFREALADHFSPLQFGVATRGGCETMNNGLGATLDLHPDWVILQAIVPAFHTLEDHLLAVGLTVQPTKCAAWSPSGLSSSLSLLPGFSLPSAGLRVFGAPIGSDSFQASFVRDALEVDVSTVHQLPLLGDPQGSFWFVITLLCATSGLSVTDYTTFVGPDVYICLV